MLPTHGFLRASMMGEKLKLFFVDVYRVSPFVRNL